MSELSGRRLVTADLTAGIVFLVLGVGALAIALTMPNFAERGADPLTAPGIFPAFVSGMVIVLGALLTARALRQHASSNDAEATRFTPLPFTIGLGLMTVAILLVGKVPFFLVMTGFTLAYSAFFVKWRGTRIEITRRLVAVAITVLVSAFLIPLAFQNIFLVRLPG